MKKILCIFLAALTIAAMGLMMTGCGRNKNEEATNAVQFETQAPTERPTVWSPKDQTTTRSTENATDADDTQSSDATASPDNSGGYAGLSQEAALDMAVKNFEGCYANGIYEGTDASGNAAWVILMITSDGTEFTAYATKDGITSGGYSDAQDTAEEPADSEDVVEY